MSNIIPNVAFVQNSHLTSAERNEFIMLLRNFFRPYIGPMRPTDDIEFCIQLSLEEFANQLRQKKLADIYVDILFSLFEVFHCTEVDIIENTLEYFVLRRLEKYLPVELVTDGPAPLRSRSPLDCVPRKLPKIALILGLPSYEKEFKVDSFFYQPYILMNFELTKIMLRYGVKFETNEEDLQQFQELNLFSIIVATGIVDWTGDELFLALINSIYTTSSNKRRLYFVTLAIELVLVHEKPHFLVLMQRAFVKSLKKLFKTITDPLITIGEICRLFDILSRGRQTKRPVEEFCNVFLQHFPKSIEPIQPRTLKHLCRCLVRDRLRDARKLPHGIWQLSIPKVLKNYIMLQRNDDEFYPEYVSMLSP